MKTPYWIFLAAQLLGCGAIIIAGVVYDISSAIQIVALVVLYFLFVVAVNTTKVNQ